MKNYRLVTCLILCLTILSAQAQEKYSKVKVYFTPGDLKARANIVGMLDIDHFWPEQGSIVSEVSARSLSKLRTSGIRYDILVDDVAANLDKINREFLTSGKNKKLPSNSRVAIEVPGSPVSGIIRTPTAFKVQSTFGGYYSFYSMDTAMTNLVTKYPAIASKTSLGKTVNGNDIWIIKISDNVATDEPSEPEILYLGLQHAREAITGASMIFFMQYLCEEYAAGNQKIKDLVDNREIYIVPCFNPDGWEYNRSTNPSGGGGWRKNRSVYGSNFGVDLNRNWGVDWGNCNAPINGPAASCGTSDPTQDTFWGSNAFSEKETGYIRTFAQTHHLTAGFDQHAYGPYYSLPFGRHSLHTLSQKGTDFYTAVPALMGTYNGMRAADSYDALGYEVAGGFKDWMLMGNIGTGTKDTVYAMTGEGAAGGGTGGTYGDFWAPSSQIVNLSASMCYQNLQLAFSAGTYADIQDLDSMNIPSLTGNFNFTIKRVGLGNDPITVSITPLENIKTIGSAWTKTSMPGYYDTAVGSIPFTLFPSLGIGQRVKFIYKVSTGGYDYSDTITKFYKGNTLLTDNMESGFATNWTNTAGTGTTASGFGYNYTGSNSWAVVTGGYGGSNAISESPAGTNYTTQSLRICNYKNTFNLTGATAAYLSFWTRYRAENFRDRLQIQVSTNGTSWTSLRGTTTVEEPGTLDDATLNGIPALTGIHDYWTHEIFDLSAYVGNAALRLRFYFTSDDDPSSFKYELDDGFYIDNVNVISTNAIFLNLLPVNFLDFTGNLTGKKVNLHWEATVDKDHQYFTVERSIDGINFTSIGQVAAGAPNTFVDNSPNNGNNYYRIGNVNTDGKMVYSKTINVPYNNYKAQVSVYPNPATDVLNLKISDKTISVVDITVTDVQGRIITALSNIQNTGNEIKINTHGIVPQVYILKVISKSGEIIGLDKFIKK